MFTYTKTSFICQFRTWKVAQWVLWLGISSSEEAVLWKITCQIFPVTVNVKIRGLHDRNLHFNEQFYFGQSEVYTFFDVLQKIQTTSYIKIRNMNLHAPVSKAEKEINKFVCELLHKNTDREITRNECQNPGLQIQGLCRCVNDFGCRTDM